MIQKKISHNNYGNGLVDMFPRMLRRLFCCDLINLKPVYGRDLQTSEMIPTVQTWTQYKSEVGLPELPSALRKGLISAIRQLTELFFNHQKREVYRNWNLFN